jgi:uncharacterized protein
MSYEATIAQIAAHAAPEERALFIRRTYMHLAGAILGFVALEYYFLTSTQLAQGMLKFMVAGRYNWLLILGGFMLLGWMARGFAHSVDSPALQYFGLAAYVVAEAVIFLPLLAVAALVTGSWEVVQTAGWLTLLLFGGLTFSVFTTRRDFSFLGSFLTIGGFVALGLIVCGSMFGFNLGLAFSGGMVILAAGAILYDTSNVLHHFPTDRHVAASLELFASVALLFWYVLRILMIISSGGRR